LALSLGFLKQTNPDILETLRANSELLYCIQTAFHSIIRERSIRREDRIEITCFFEELPLRGLGVVRISLKPARIYFETFLMTLKGCIKALSISTSVSSNRFAL